MVKDITPKSWLQSHFASTTTTDFPPTNEGTSQAVDDVSPQTKHYQTSTVYKPIKRNPSSVILEKAFQAQPGDSLDQPLV